jgi:small subunit ribosomal protein S20
MPNRKSAIKSLRKSAKRHERNKAVLSELKTRDKKYLALVTDKKFDEAKNYLKEYIIKLDKAASKNMIHKNKASRKASRLTKKLNSAITARTA